MNPLRSLAFDADVIARYATTIKGPIVLVGHSYSDAAISQAAPLRNDVIALVFLSAFELDQGESCASIQEPFRAPMLASAIVPSPYDAPDAPGGPDLFIKISEFHQAFCADLPASVAAAMAVSQRPLSAAALTETATTAGWKNLPSWYMVSEQGNAIQPDCERYMARRMNASVESVSKGSHAAFIARPDIAAGLILKAVDTTWG
jgi:pimeloyl-ACP methyl ester carboxylesterase